MPKDNPLSIINTEFQLQDSTSTSLKMYEVFVNANNVLLNRRQATHSLFVAVNTVIAGIGGYQLFATQENTSGLPILAGIVGVLACYLWRLLLLLIKENINARYNVIYQMENSLPLKPFTAELEDLKTCTNRSRYLSSTRIEARIPFLFMLIYVVLLVVSVVSMLMS